MMKIGALWWPSVGTQVLMVSVDKRIKPHCRIGETFKVVEIHPEKDRLKFDHCVCGEKHHAQVCDWTWSTYHNLFLM